MDLPARVAPVRPTLPCTVETVEFFLSEPSAGVISAVAGAPGPFLVLGAGGKIGLHLCLMLRRALDALGRRDEVIAASRFQHLRERSEFDQHGILVRACDLTDAAAVAALPDAPTVFFLAGVKFGTAADPVLLRKVNVDMPQLVAQRFRGTRIVAFSSGNVYPFVRPDSGGATESMPLQPVGEYAKSCVAREQVFADAAARDHTRVVLIRLNYAVEFRYGLLVDVAQKVLQDAVVDVTTGYVNVIWQRDAVAHAIQALQLASAPATPLNVTGPDVISVRALAHGFGELLQRPVQVTGREADTAWLNNASRSHQLFGLPPTPLADMMGWVAAWLTEVGTTWNKPTGYDRRDGLF